MLRLCSADIAHLFRPSQLSAEHYWVPHIFLLNKTQANQWFLQLPIILTLGAFFSGRGAPKIKWFSLSCLFYWKLLIVKKTVFTHISPLTALCQLVSSPITETTKILITVALSIMMIMMIGNQEFSFFSEMGQILKPSRHYRGLLVGILTI